MSTTIVYDDWEMPGLPAPVADALRMRAAPSTSPLAHDAHATHTAGAHRAAADIVDVPLALGLIP